MKKYVPINVEKGELEVSPATLKVKKDFRYKPWHPTMGTNPSGNVLGEAGDVIIPEYMREAYLKGSTPIKRYIVDMLKLRNGWKMQEGGPIKPMSIVDVGYQIPPDFFTTGIVAAEPQVPDYTGISFAQAFAKARAEQGAGGTFVWNDKTYGTKYATEVEQPVQPEATVGKLPVTGVSPVAKVAAAGIAGKTFTIPKYVIPEKQVARTAVKGVVSKVIPEVEAKNVPVTEKEQVVIVPSGKKAAIRKKLTGELPYRKTAEVPKKVVMYPKTSVAGKVIPDVIHVKEVVEEEAAMPGQKGAAGKYKWKAPAVEGTVKEIIEPVQKELPDIIFGTASKSVHNKYKEIISREKKHGDYAILDKNDKKMYVFDNENKFLFSTQTMIGENDTDLPRTTPGIKKYEFKKGTFMPKNTPVGSYGIGSTGMSKKYPLGFIDIVPSRKELIDSLSTLGIHQLYPEHREERLSLVKKGVYCGSWGCVNIATDEDFLKVKKILNTGLDSLYVIR